MAPSQEEAEANSVKETDMAHNTTTHEVIVYGSANCPSCARTCAFLRSKGIPHTYVDVEADPEGFALVKANGSQMPLVLSPIGPWSGMRPDKIVALINHFAQTPPGSAVAGAGKAAPDKMGA